MAKKDDELIREFNEMADGIKRITDQLKDIPVSHPKRKRKKGSGDNDDGDDGDGEGGGEEKEEMSEEEKKAENRKQKAIAALEDLGKLAKFGMGVLREYWDINKNVEIKTIELKKIEKIFELEKSLIIQRAENEINLMTAQVDRELAVMLTKTSFDSVTGKINKGVYESYRANIKAQAERGKLAVGVSRVERMKGVDIQKTTLKKEMDVTKNELEQAVLERKKANLWYRGGGGTLDVVGRGLMNARHPAALAVGAALQGVGNIIENVGQNRVQKSELELKKRGAEMESDYAKYLKTYEYYKNQSDYVAELEKTDVEYEAQMLEAYSRLAESIEGFIDKTDAGLTDIGRMYGLMGGQLLGFRSPNNSMASTLALFGYETADFAKIISGYQSGTGRTGIFSDKDISMSKFLDTFVGDNGYAGRLATAMHDFGYGMADASTLALKNMTNISKHGLSVRKYSADIEKNLSLVNRFNFKDGVDGFMKMTSRALTMKGSIESYANVVGKFSELDLQGILQASASLNVLGGNAALYSDPLGLLYESRMDPNALIKRVQAMTQEYGTFKNGKMEYGFAAVEMMSNIAKLTGRGIEDIRKELYETEKRRQLDGVLTKLTESQRDFVAANATWGEEAGDWVINVGGVRKLARNVGKDELDRVIPETTEDGLKNITRDTRNIRVGLKQLFSLEEDRTVEEIRSRYLFFSTFFGLYLEENDTRTGLYLKNVNEAIREHGSQVNDTMEGITESNKNIIQLAVDARADFQKNIETRIWDANRVLGDISQGLKKEYVENSPETKNTLTTAVNNMYQHQSNMENVSGGTSSQYGKPTVQRMELTPLSSTLPSEDLENTRDTITYGSQYNPITNVVTSPEDVNLSWRRGDVVDKMFVETARRINAIDSYVENTDELFGLSSGSNGKMDVKVRLGGRAKVNCSGYSGSDVSAALSRNPFALKKLSTMFLKEVSKYSDNRGTVNVRADVGEIFDT